ncbi:unnamed protein product [Rhizoctonia solani]|uniref:Zn(2)-C6 fungal-type domain-containing protein n=1 Tax=Rhizoctonia solani TaxID=456999 RepID=A0A8H3D2G3_9AGAM|nr:unnamed protein product [Rhizoctonia solani]
MSHPSASTGPTRTPANPSRSTPLFRGTGCHYCRTRKVKCDAGKPFCARCIQQNTTDRCKYDEVKKSKLTLVKEENAELKARLALAERELARRSSPTLALPAEDVKEPPSSTFSQLALDADDELEHGHGQDEEPDDGVSGDPINIGPVPFLVQPQQHSTRPEHYPTGPAHVPRLNTYPQFQRLPRPHPLPNDPYQPAYQGPYYSQVLAGNTFHSTGFTQEAGYTRSAPYTPQVHTGPLPDGYNTWPPTPIDPVPPSASTPGFTPSPSSRQWRQLPGSPPGSYPSNPSINYPGGAMFRDDGRYFGGAMPSYDAYQGVHQRPAPAPPVYGRDMVMEYFQKWKVEPQPQAYIEDQYTQAPTDGSWALVGNWWERDDLSVSQRNHLLELVLPYRKQLGLEIWVPRFLASLHLPPKRRPHPGFMWMLYSFAAFFSGNPELHELLPTFLERARRNLDESFASSDRLFDYIRGQTLYASIKFLSGMVREASMATTSACHAAMMCGLHKISSPVTAPKAQDREQPAYSSSQTGFQLEPASSPHEHGERIAAFWQLALVDISAAATTDFPGMLRYDGDERSRVETVFPRPLEEYINGAASQVPYATLGDFFTSREIPNPPDIVITMQVKATALLERAVRLSTKWSQGKQIYDNEFNIVFQTLQHFKSYLPSMRPQEGNIAESELPRSTNGLIYERLFPYFMVWDAEIELLRILEEEQMTARLGCLQSAREIRNLVTLLEDQEVAVLGVLLGHCFKSALKVFRREIARCREQYDEANVEILTQDLNIVTHALNLISENHRLTAIQPERTDRTRIREFPV